MPNLLPSENRKKVLKEFTLRLIIVFLTLIFVTICIAIVLLVPSYILSQVKETSVSNDVEIFNETMEFKKNNLSSEILKKELFKMEILQQGEDVLVSKLISVIVKNKTDDIKIDGIFYDLVDKGKTISLIIRGISNKRSSLIIFVNKLKGENIFNEVDLPVSNLIKDEEVDFSIKIIVKNN